MATTGGDRSAQFPAVERKYGVPVAHWLDLLAASDAKKYDEQLALYKCGKKTFNVPLDWKVDGPLVVAMARYRLAELT